jgi:hypothetical protein
MDHPIMSTHTSIIFLELTTLADRGQRYRVIHDGVTLMESSRNPEFDAGRALLAKGITGWLEVWHKGATFPAMFLDIAKAARLTVEEGAHEGLRFVRWRPRADDGLPDAVSCRADSSRTARNELQVGRP